MDKELMEKICERFAINERSRSDFENIYLPNKFLVDWRDYVSRTYSKDEAAALFERLAGKCFTDFSFFRENEEVHSLFSAADKEYSLEELQNNLPKRVLKKVMKQFFTDRGYEFKMDDPCLCVFFPSGKYELVAKFVFGGMLSQLEYGIVGYEKDTLHCLRNIKLSYACEQLWGCGVSQWQLIKTEESLVKALTVVFDQCERLSMTLKDL